MATATTYKPISWIFLRSEGLTMWTTSESFRIRGHSIPHDPKTTNQINSRGFLAEAKAQWSTLSATDKAAWGAFARATIHINKREQPVKGRGIDAFVAASITRQTAGLDAMPGLPVGNFVPQAPTALDLLPGADARELVFRIEHKNASLLSHAMLVRMTPTGASPARRPYKSSLRHVRGVGPESVIALPASGETVRIADTRFELEPGCIYAVEVRIMRLADGAVSEPFYNAAVREELPSAPAPQAAPEPATATATAAANAAAGEIDTGEAEAGETAAARSAKIARTAQGAESPGAAIAAGEAETEAAEPMPPKPNTSAQTPTATSRTALIANSSLAEIADRHGSKYFPSAYVLYKHFSPNPGRKRLTVVGTTRGGTNLVRTKDL